MRISDWSSDVCSSDLVLRAGPAPRFGGPGRDGGAGHVRGDKQRRQPERAPPAHARRAPHEGRRFEGLLLAAHALRRRRPRRRGGRPDRRRDARRLESYVACRMHDSVTVHMAAAPDTVWGLVSDITNTGRFSPETFEAEWLDGATGLAVGVRFRGHVKRNAIGRAHV